MKSIRMFSLLFLLVLTLGFVTSVSAWDGVRLEYNYNQNNVNSLAYNCLDSSCSSVSSFGGDYPYGSSTSTGQITIDYPANLQDQGYAIYHVSPGYVPLEFKADWYCNSGSSCGPVEKNYEFNKIDTCSSTIDSFTVTNDAYANEPVTVDVDASLSSEVSSAFEEADTGVKHVPDPLKDQYYSANTDIILVIEDSNGNTVYSDEKSENIYMSSSEKVEFTWTPQNSGDHNVKVKTDVVDDQCASSETLSTSKSIDVQEERPLNEYYTIINGLSIQDPNPIVGENQEFSFTKISNYANSQGDLRPVDTDIEVEITDENGDVVKFAEAIYSENANPEDPQEVGFDWTPSSEGVYTVRASGESIQEFGSYPRRPQTEEINVDVDPKPTYNVVFKVTDGSGNDVSGATVSFNGESKTTNSNGAVEFLGLEEGRYSYSIIKSGYETALEDVDVTSDKIVSVTIREENTAPVISNLPSVSFVEGSSESLNLNNYVSDDQSPESDLTWSTTSNNNVDVSISSGVATFTDSGFTGSESVQFRVHDPQGLSDYETTTVTVNPSNTPPSVGNIPDQALNEDESRQDAINLRNYVNDAEDSINQLNIDLSSSNNKCGASIGSDEYIDIQPDTNFAGSCDITVQVTDTEGATDTDSFTIQVNSVNDKPVITSAPIPSDGATGVVRPVNLEIEVNDVDDNNIDVRFYDASNDEQIGTTQSGDSASVNWNNLNEGETYNWYVEADDGVDTTTSQTWSFTVVQNEDPISDFSYSPQSPVIQEPVNFDGSSSYDNDGSINSYDWNFGDGSSATGQSPTYSYSSAGTYTVELTVEDDDGATDSTSQTVTVLDTEDPQISNLRPNGAVSVKRPEISADFSDNDELSNYTLKIDGTEYSSGSLDGESDSASFTPVDNLAYGDHTYTWLVEDASGNTASESDSFKINEPPQVTFTVNDSNPLTNQVVEANASDSSDPDGNIVNYEWDWSDDGNFESTGKVNSTSYPDNGTYTIRLRVTDDTGLSSHATEQITVDNRPPTADFSFSKSDRKVDVDASSSSDLDGSIYTYEWDWTSDGTFESLGRSTSHTYPSRQQYSITLRVTDDDGETDTVTRTVNLENNPPNRPFNPSPDDGATGVSVSPNLGVNVTDPDGDFMNASFYSVAGDLIGKVEDVPSGDRPQVKWYGLNRFTQYGWYVDVSDGQYSNRSSIWSFTTGGNYAPSPSFTYNDSNPDVGDVIEFDASGSSDTDGSITNYEWDWKSDGTYESKGRTATHIYSSKGNYSVTLRVTDDQGAQNIVTREISVNTTKVEVRPIASFNFTPLNPARGEDIIFDGSGSSDPDGVISSYSWNFDDGSTDMGEEVTHSYGLGGLYEVNLSVEDNEGLKDSVMRIVNVSRSNIAPSALISYYPTSPNVSEEVTFNASNSFDQDGRISSYNWDLDEDGNYERSGKVVNESFSEGNYTVGLRVEDDDGAVDRDSVEVVVSDSIVAPNSPPKAEFDYSPVNPEIGETVSFDGSPSMDNDGNVVSYEWDLDGDGTFERTGLNQNYQFNTSGAKDVTLKVTDNDGSSSQVSKTINVVSSQPPVFDPRPSDQVIVKGMSFRYDIDVVNETQYLDWSVNNVRFDISDKGVVKNSTSLDIGNYPLNVTVTDTVGRSNPANFNLEVINGSLLIDSYVNGTYYQDNRTTVKGINSSIINSSEINNSYIELSKIIESTLLNSEAFRCRIVDSVFEDSICRNSRIEGSSVTENSEIVDNSEVYDSNIQNSRVSDSYINPSNITETDVGNSSEVKDSKASNSIIDNCDVTSSELNYTICRDSRIGYSTLEESEVKNSSINNTESFNSTIIDSDITNSTLNNSLVNASTLENSTLENSTVENSNVSDSEALNCEIYSSNVSGLNCQDSLIDNSEIENSTVNNSEIIESNVTDSNVSDSEVNNSVTDDSNVTDSNISDSEVSDSNITNSSINNSTVENSTVEDSDLDNSTVKNSSVEDSNVTDSNITDSEVNNSTINDSIVENSTVNDSNITNSTINNSIVDNSTIENSTLENSTIENGTIENGTIIDGCLNYSGDQYCSDDNETEDEVDEIYNNSQPEASFTVSSTSTSPGEVVSLDASGSTDSDGNITDFSWDLGDGTNKEGVDIDHSYSSTGDYVITLTVRDDVGATDTASRTISVSSDTSSGGGGGGGGGGGYISPSDGGSDPGDGDGTEIDVEAEEFEVNIEQGESITRNYDISSSGLTEVDLSVEGDASEYIELGESRFELDGEKSVPVEITVPEDVDPQTIEGKIIYSWEDQSGESNVRINVMPEGDIQIYLSAVTDSSYSSSEDINYKIRIGNRDPGKELEKNDLIVRGTLIDSEGNTVKRFTETVRLKDGFRLKVKDFTLEDNPGPGSYLMEIKAEYGDEEIRGSSEFTVSGLNIVGRFSDAPGSWIGGLIALLMIISALIYNRIR